MILPRLAGLSAYQIESFVAAVEDEMQDLGYRTRMADSVGPEVKVCMSKPPEPELCTRLTEVGQPWVIYSPSNIANIQDDRYEFMHGDGTPSRTTTREPVSNIPVSFSFSNDTTGNRSLLRVGDRWTLSVKGPPNSDVVMVGGSGGSTARNTMGRTNAAGVWTTSGSPGVAELGSWSQQIFVGGQLAGTLNFQVVAAPVSSGNGQKSTEETLREEAEKEVSQGQPDWMASLTSNPWLLIGGAAAALFLLGRKS